MQRASLAPEFRYLISGQNQHFIGLSIRETTITPYEVRGHGESFNKFLLCFRQYGSNTPGLSNPQQNSPTHNMLHSRDNQETHLIHVHLTHPILTTKTLNKLLTYFKRCNNSPNVLTDAIVDNINEHFKIFTSKLQKGELKPGDIYEASNNPTYNEYKAKNPSGKLPTLAEHQKCSEKAAGCDLEMIGDSVKWVVPTVTSRTPTIAKPFEITSTANVQNNGSSASNLPVIGTVLGVAVLLYKFGFLNCLTKRCARKNENKRNVEVNTRRA